MFMKAYLAIYDWLSSIQKFNLKNSISKTKTIPTHENNFL